MGMKIKYIWVATTWNYNGTVVVDGSQKNDKPSWAHTTDLFSKKLTSSLFSAMPDHHQQLHKDATVYMLAESHSYGLKLEYQNKPPILGLLESSNLG